MIHNFLASEPRAYNGEPKILEQVEKITLRLKQRNGWPVRNISAKTDQACRNLQISIHGWSLASCHFYISEFLPNQNPIFTKPDKTRSIAKMFNLFLMCVFIYKY